MSNVGYCTYVRRNLLLDGGHLELLWYLHYAAMNSYTWILDGERRNACRILLGKHLTKCPLGRTRRRWKDNIKTYDVAEAGRWEYLRIVPHYGFCYLWCLTLGFCRSSDMYLIITFTLPVKCGTVALRNVVCFGVVERGIRSLPLSPVLSAAKAEAQTGASRTIFPNTVTTY